jgi:hypothetical protein
VRVALKGARDPGIATFCAYSLLPSFFGYFSSAEHLGFAFSFYCALIAGAPRGAVRLLLPPFFCNACTQRYTEAVLHDLVGFFCGDVRVAASGATAEHARALLASALRHLRLLPGTHLNVLKILERRRWPAREVFRFFVECFLRPQLAGQAACAPLAANGGALPALFRALLALATERAVRPLFEAESSVELPQAFADLDDPGLAFVTTPFDIAVLLDLARDCVELPHLLRILRPDRYAGAQPFAPIAVKVFPKVPAPALPSSGWRDVVFQRLPDPPAPQDPALERRFRMVQKLADDACTTPVRLLEARGEPRAGPDGFYEFAVARALADATERARQFERLLVHRFVLRRLAQWKDLVGAALAVRLNGAAHAFLAARFAALTAKQALDQRALAAEAIRELSPIFDCAYARQLFYAMRAEKLTANYRRQGELERLARTWALAMQKTCADTAPPPLFRSSRMRAISQRVNENVHALRTMAAIPFERRFFRIVEVVRSLEYIEEAVGEDVSLCRYAVALSQSDGVDGEFIVTVVKISACLFKNQEFVKQLTTEALRHWYRFEEIVTEMVQKDSAVAGLYWQIHDNLMVLL